MSSSTWRAATLNSFRGTDHVVLIAASHDTREDAVIHDEIGRIGGHAELCSFESLFRRKTFANGTSESKLRA